MKIKVNSMITIKNPSKKIKDFCKNNLVIKNPDVQKKQLMGFWTGNIPKTLKMFSINNGNYILPIGEIDNVWKLHPIKEDYEINFGKHKKLDFPKNKMKLYDYQEEAVGKMIKAKRGILSSKCGSGKSIMLLEMIRKIGYKALIICEKKEIQLQFRDYLVNCFDMKKGDYGLISEGNVEIGKYITIGLRQTLARVDLTPYKYEFGTIAVDEGQNVGGSVTKCTQYSKILNNLAAEYRFAVSATAYRVDGLTRCMYSLLNTIKYEIPEDAVEDKTIKAKIQPILTDYEIPEECLKWDGTLNYTELPTVMAEDRKRNELITKYLKENKDNYCLILSDRLSALENLQAMLEDGLLINGSMTSKKAKKERENAIEKMRQKQEHYLFASYNLAREGLDIKPLNRLFLIAPTKNKISLIQSVR
jgi:superfamily II DNA or RNA helicase